MRFSCLLLALTLRGQVFDATQVERGRAQFKSSCGFCHGDDATGNRAPDLIRSAVLSHDTDGDQLGPVIRNGRPDNGMPGFSCTVRLMPRCAVTGCRAIIPWRNCSPEMPPRGRLTSTAPAVAPLAIR